MTEQIDHDSWRMVRLLHVHFVSRVNQSPCDTLSWWISWLVLSLGVYVPIEIKIKLNLKKIKNNTIMCFEAQTLKWQKFSNLCDCGEESLTPNSLNNWEWCHWHENNTSLPEEWIKQTLSDFWFILWKINWWCQRIDGNENWKHWYSFLLSTEIHQWFRLLIESKLTQWNINKYIFITTKMMNKKFMFWLLWMKVDEKIIKQWEKMNLISSIKIIKLWFQKIVKWIDELKWK